MKLVLNKLVYLILITIQIAWDTALCANELRQVSTCICPGYSVVYECSVDGNGFTLWSGSIFDCPLSGNEIVLGHSMFMESEGVIGNCNDGNIVGRSIQANLNTYVSQLTILDYNPAAFNGGNVSCSFDSVSITTIGTAELMTSDPFPPPSDIQLIQMSTEQLMFNWSSPAVSCPGLSYRIESDCGTCSSYTNSTYTICFINQDATAIDTCNFAVGTIICDNIVGNLSKPMNVILRGTTPSSSRSMNIGIILGVCIPVIIVLTLLIIFIGIIIIFYCKKKRTQSPGIDPIDSSHDPMNEANLVVNGDQYDPEKFKVESTPVPGPVGYIFHQPTGKLIHPKGGLRDPSNNTRLVVHSDRNDPARFQVRFVPVSVPGRRRLGYIEHVSSGKVVHPSGGSKNPGNNTLLVYHEHRHDGALFEFDEKDKVIKHTGGKIWHPNGGALHPKNDTKCVLHSDRHAAAKFYFGDTNGNPVSPYGDGNIVSQESEQ